jgi:hypothetical protein
MYLCFLLFLLFYNYHIGGVTVSALVVYRGFEPRSGQTKDDEIGMCYFSGQHATLRSKSKDWLARNDDNLSEWGDMSTH